MDNKDVEKKDDLDLKSKDQDKEIQDKQDHDDNHDKENLIPKSELDRVLKDMHKYKSAYRELESKFRETEINELKKREEWKSLAERHELEAGEYKNKLEYLQASLINEKKYNALLQATKQIGLRVEAERDLELLDLSELMVETTSTGRINVLNASQFAAKIKSLRPHWFGKSGGNLNTDVPSVVGDKAVTYDELEELSKKAQKSGDFDEYKKKLLQFKKQQQ